MEQIVPIGSEWATRYPNLIGFDRSPRTAIACPVCGNPTMSCTHEQEIPMPPTAKKTAEKADAKTAADKAKENPPAAATDPAQTGAPEPEPKLRKKDIPDGLVESGDGMYRATKDISVGFIPRGTKVHSHVLLVAEGGEISAVALATRLSAYADAEGFEVK
ncbi:hypothetical protein [Phycicoccus sp.]|uniref:hypothetical protein n=1 Tax=Phycicoccus sp. TaxID=1902410 RepID=UPI002C339E9A|nr:hypothetical protein [Phycicoccus sp.]HMM95392.1 hypothetical protein [Phycicoccus sp.]